ncbi:MAG: TIGR03118 family protein, partial [Acidobacteria bacterium]|nr:TIGR03118 family protein [Acidobacteriota bacterium]
NIVSDGSVQAQHTDPTLINPWGISIGPQFWIDTTGTGMSLVEGAGGNEFFSVTVPAANPAASHGLPAGTVYNPDASIFNIPGKGSASFLFGTLDGTISAWNTTTPQAVIVANNSSSKASYTDIALVKNNAGTFLLAANFSGGTVDVFDSNFAASHLTGNLSDPSLPAGFKPFGIHTIGNNIYVAYAQANAQGREAVGAGLGYVNQFDLNGNLVKRAISQGNLNAPWGMALAPQGFGAFGGALLVGNFGDGVINAYDPVSFALKGQITGSDGAPLANSGLWEIVFGAGTSTGGTAATAGDPNTLYFSAGINGEKGGLFGSIVPSAPAGAADFTITSSTPTVSVKAGQAGNLSLNLAAVNGFSGTVTLSCSGLPTGDSCGFSPASVNVGGTTPVMVGLAITTAAGTPTTPPPTGYTASLARHRGVVLAGLLPLGLLGFAGLRRRSALLRGSVLACVCMLALGTLSGCSSGTMASQPTPNPPTPTPTPATSQLTITATSGTLSHSVTVGLTTN